MISGRASERVPFEFSKLSRFAWLVWFVNKPSTFNNKTIWTTEFNSHLFSYERPNQINSLEHQKNDWNYCRNFQQDDREITQQMFHSARHNQDCPFMIKLIKQRERLNLLNCIKEQQFPATFADDFLLFSSNLDSFRHIFPYYFYSMEEWI